MKPTYEELEARHGHRELVEKLEAERDEAKNQLDSARHSVEVLEARVAELGAAGGEAIYGFYEDEYPIYTDAQGAHSELSSVMTVDEANGLVERLKQTKAEVGRLTDENRQLRTDKAMLLRDHKGAQARVAGLEAERDTAWNAAIRAAAKACSDLQDKADAVAEEYGALPDEDLDPDGYECAEAIRALLRKGGSDDQ